MAADAPADILAALDAADYNAKLPPWPEDHPEFGHALKSHLYYDDAGHIVGLHYVFDHAGARRDATLSMNGKGWHWDALPTPTPLYGVLDLALRPDDPVCLCDDETESGAAWALLPGHVCISWFGGRGGVATTAWAALAGREVLVWPTAGKPTQRAAQEAAAAAKAAGATVKLIRPPDESPEGWGPSDAVEAGWGPEEVTSWLLERRVGQPHVEVPEKEKRTKKAKGPLPPEAAAALVELEAAPTVVPHIPEDERPFQMLGHNHGTYYYVPGDGGQVVHIGGANHSKQALLMLAPLHYWETTYACKGREGWDMVANSLIRGSHRIGIYDPWRIRGRGAWWDRGRVVVHLGDRLIVDGVETPLRQMESDYLYEIGPRIRLGASEPLPAAESGRLLDLCKMLSWERPISAYLLAGWCALAPICGALQWRPHIFVTGQGGAGKSWCYQKIIIPAVGNAGLALAASATEPGIRRALGSDALPVMIDEFEAKDQIGVARVQAVMNLMRYSSSETSAVIVKGTQGGQGVDMFQVRSMFATLAIGSVATDYADVTRTSTLTLKAMPANGASAAKFHAIETAQAALFKEDWTDGLHARVIGLIPTIRRNAEIFSVAGAQVLGTRRLGDQIGALLAGAFALTSSHEVTPEAATKWIDAQDWSEEKEVVLDTDGPSCFARIMEHVVQVEARGSGVRRSVAELVKVIYYASGDELVSADVALATLKRMGLLPLENKLIAISNTHSAIGDILYNTPWSPNWGARLKTIPGAFGSDGAMRFGPTVSRAVIVPLV